MNLIEKTYGWKRQAKDQKTCPVPVIELLDVSVTPAKLEDQTPVQFFASSKAKKIKNAALFDFLQFETDTAYKEIVSSI